MLFRSINPPSSSFSRRIGAGGGAVVDSFNTPTLPSLFAAAEVVDVGAGGVDALYSGGLAAAALFGHKSSEAVGLPGILSPGCQIPALLSIRVLWRRALAAVERRR